MVTGCFDDSDDSTDTIEISDPIPKPTSEGNRGNAPDDFRYPDEDEDEEIKVGTIFGNGKSTVYSIFVLRESIDIKTRDPYRFTCKVRLVEGVDDLFNDPIHKPITLEGKKYSEYGFYPKDNDEPYFKCKSAYFNSEGKESKAKPVKKDIIASKVYDYVTKNM